MPDVQRKLVIVSGAPGAGKTTLAVPLAKRLNFPLFSKDIIKETLTNVFGDSGGDLTASRRIGGASMELIWCMAIHAPHAVLEANFRPNSDYERAKLTGLEAAIVEVHCDCGRVETAKRFRERAAAKGHQAAHPLKEMPDDMLDEYDRPMRIGPVVEVDTRTPVDLDRILTEVQRFL